MCTNPVLTGLKRYCNYLDITSVYSLNSQKLPGRFSHGLGTRVTVHMYTHHSIIWTTFFLGSLHVYCSGDMTKQFCKNRELSSKKSGKVRVGKDLMCHCRNELEFIAQGNHVYTPARLIYTKRKSYSGFKWPNAVHVIMS